MPTRYGRSPWLDRYPVRKRPAFPVFKGIIEAPLVIIGGGLTGAMTAYACAVAGEKVILLEADRLGSGGSGSASGVFAGEATASFRDLEAASGRRVARTHFEQARRAVADLVAAARRLGISAEVDALPAFRVLAQGAGSKPLQKEADARKSADLDGVWRKPAAILSATGIDAAGGIRLSSWGQCDPYRLLLGFAAAAAKRGAALYERSPVRKITFNRRVATVLTAHGRITAARVVHCTGEPTMLVKALRRHFTFETQSLVLSDVLPAATRKEVGPRASIVCDQDEPPHLVRWTGDHRVLVAGATGAPPPARQLDKFHLQRTGQLMYELTRLYPAVSGVQPAYGWSMPLASSADGGLYAGPHRNFPHQLFALATAHDPARAYLASRILARHVTGANTTDDEHFGFARVL